MLPRKSPEPTVAPDVMLDELESDIEALRVAYEKYFLGVDRTAPVRARERLERKLRLLENTPFRVTSHRFRMAGLRARYVTYAHYWTRLLDQIERGVSRRDLAVKAAAARQAATPPAASASAATPRVASPPQGDASPAPARALVDEDNVREVFERLVAAKRAAGEPTDGMTLPALLRKLTRDAPKLSEQHGGRPLRFEVELRDGKVRVRARPV